MSNDQETAQSPHTDHHDYLQSQISGEVNSSLFYNDNVRYNYMELYSDTVEFHGFSSIIRAMKVSF